VTKKAEIMVVDDDQAHRTMLRTLIKGWGHVVTEADDGQAAVDLVAQSAFDLILMDIRMIKMSGLEALPAIRELNPAIPILIMTAYSSVETAVTALKAGAYDYLTKPLDFDKLKLTIERAMEHQRLKTENRRLKEALDLRFDQGKIIGQSPAMVRLLETAAQVAVSEATVMICGGSGTGKELVAGVIHHNSARRKGPFVKINCAALTETLLESELFGHEKGAFTGAERLREGKFVQAHGGTLFLDEVSEMPIAMQVKLLRVLQEREVTRVGGETVIPVDVRLVVATNKHIPDLIREGGFREDLYYRLNVVNLDLPPLRERRGDIPLLAQHFLTHFNQRNAKEIRGFSPQAMALLGRYHWPGNVRELMNAVERAVVLARELYLDVADFAFLAPDTAAIAGGAEAAAGGVGEDALELPAGLPLESVEREAILKTLEAVGGNKSEAARQLGITRKTLASKLKKYGVMP
jgi:two-component system, NtrC family, response regulator HydG